MGPCASGCRAIPVDRKITQVWVMDQGKQVRQTAITTGIADSLFTEIAEGTLKEGDTGDPGD